MMKRIARIVWILLLVVAFLTPCAFAAENVSYVKLNQVQQKDANLTMYVSMTDAEGSLCKGNYTADQFSISVDGKALDVDNVRSFNPDKEGIHFVFSVDVSRSLTQEMIKNVRASICTFVDEMGKNDSVSVLTFGETVTKLITDSTDRVKIKAVVNSIEADEDMTALYKGVIDAVNIADAVGGRSAVIIITDGKNDPTEEMKSYTKDSIYENVKAAQVPLYCVGLNDKGSGVDAESLMELSEATGGVQQIIKTAQMPNRLKGIRSTMRYAKVLEATLVNTENKAGFDEVSTFKVGFQDGDGDFITSNPLDQIINWKNVPVPQISPSPTPIPQIDLELDESEIMYVSGEMVTITGAIEVAQGSVAAEDLFITVNGEPWRVSELMLNGNGYTFSATGMISSATTTLEVQAEIANSGIASRVQKMNAVLPTAAPTATPEPILSVSLDDAGRDLILDVGKAISVSGVIEVEGAINPDNLKIYINGEVCEGTIRSINRSQFEFRADYMIQDNTPEELSIQVQMDGTEIYSRAQKLYLATPSPTPNPEIYFSLNDAAIVHEEGKPVTVRGNIEVLSGEVVAEDLALYVNNEKWDMELEAFSDGTFGFTAEQNLADASLTQLDVKIRLDSNIKVVSNAEKLAVSTPVPTATPSPTPRPIVTPPPTDAPTEVPPTPEVTPVVVPIETEAPIPEDASFFTGMITRVMSIIGDMMENGTIWYVVAGLAVVVILIVLLIVLLVTRAKKRKEEYISPVSGDSSFDTGSRDNTEQSATRREDDADATVRSERNSDEDSDFISDKRTASGTMRIDNEKGAGGTVRLGYDEVPTGTVRIEEVKSIDLRIEEIRDGQFCEERHLNIECDAELVFGRGDEADVVINDRTVSSRHLAMIYDGTDVYIKDLASTNGTKLNGKAVNPREPMQLKSGDAVVIGKTMLKVSFTDPDMN